MAEYDNTNTALVFWSDPRDPVVGSGRINIEGEEKSIIVTEGKTKNGKVVRRVYVESGVLFEVNSTNEKAPALSGPITLAGTERDQLAFWEKQGAKGPFLSGMLSVQQNREASSSASASRFGRVTPAPKADFEDDIPF